MIFQFSLKVKKIYRRLLKQLKELGLKISKEKTKVVNFDDEDFDFLGYTFEHQRKRKRDGKPYFIVKPKESTWKDFRQKIKAKTGKTLTLNVKAWLERVNSVIRGKVNYFLNIYKAVKANEFYGKKSHCFINAFKNKLLAIDGYIRRRLRVAMIHKNPSQRKGWLMTTKWNNEYFAKVYLFHLFGYIIILNTDIRLKTILYEEKAKEEATKKSSENQTAREELL